VAVEKVAFLEKLPKFGIENVQESRESFIAHPDAIFVFTIFPGGSFSTATPVFNNGRLQHHGRRRPKKI
jgi:hypothetical protein